MTAAFTESVVEEAALAWLEALGYGVLHGPDISPDGATLTPVPSQKEREKYSDVLLEGRLRSALARLNPGLPPEALEDAYRKLTHRGGYEFAGLAQRARQLRREHTSAEHLLWELVRDRQFMDLKFRRQHQIGDYITDFYCHEQKLVVELDGEVHESATRHKVDMVRDSYLRGLGLTVLRFKNAELMADPEKVLMATFGRRSDGLPTNSPPHQGEGQGGGGSWGP